MNCSSQEKKIAKKKNFGDRNSGQVYRRPNRYWFLQKKVKKKWVSINWWVIYWLRVGIKASGMSYHSRVAWKKQIPHTHTHKKNIERK